MTPQFCEIYGFPQPPHVVCLNPGFFAPSHSVLLLNKNVIMDILESQVTDLNYLADSPLAISSEMNGQRQSSAESTGVVPNGGMKRKADESSTPTAPQPRAKRNRYISIAW